MNEPTITESISKNDREDCIGALTQIAAAAIRERSTAAELISEFEISNLLKDENLTSLNSDKTDEDISLILTQLVHENEDLHKLIGTGSPCYYSLHHMTEAYAKILLHKLDSPLRLIAETVRQNSYEYQRPILLDIFTKPPFNLEYQQVLDHLAIMAATEDYGDIATTSTSAFGIYLYSTSHLETDYAVMLAEWLDVGQSDNP